MNKKMFIKTMKDLKSLTDDSHGVHLAMKKLSPDFGGFYNDRAETIVVDLLRDAFNDNENDWLGYFIYELNWGNEYRPGTITDKGGKIKLKTLDNLYNLLIGKQQYE
jgi:hypothetical protein